MIAAIYARVSTVDQDCQLQLTELREYCRRCGWDSVEYVEKASGKAGSRRPVLTQLMADARMKKFDTVIVWKLDRFGRSLSHLLDTIRQLDHYGVRFIAVTQAIDTDKRSPMGTLILSIMGAFAQFERDLIVERTTAGAIQRAADFAKGKARPSISGKNLPHGRPKRIFRRDQAAEMVRGGMSMRAVAKALQVPYTTIHDAMQKAA